MNKVWKRSLSLFLAIVMILGNVPVNALAADTVEAVSCDHANAQITGVADATCDADGCTYWSCPDCSETWEEVIPAAGHAYASTELDTVIVYTCGRCSHSYEEMKAVQDDTVQNDTVQEAPVQDSTVQEDAVQEAPAFMALAPESRAAALSGIAWVNADKDTEPLDLIGIAAKGGIRDAVLRAVNWYDPENPTQYTVYCTVDGVTLNVASYRDLYNNLDAANKLADEMKNSVSQDTTVSFDIKDANGNLIAVANIGFRSFKTLESADISNIVYEAEAAPDDLQAAVEAEVSKITVNGLTQAELDDLGQCITYTVNEKTYEFPGPGQSDNVYKNVITATVTEGMTGETATISGGTVTLRNSTPKYDVTYYASVEDMAAGKAYAEESQFKGYDTPAVQTPVRVHYLFAGWYMVDEAGKISESAGVAETVSRDTVYVAKWQAEQDEHTPGDVANNDVPDGIDDRDQTFVVTYYDSADVASRKVLLTKEVSYDGYLTHPTKAEVEEAGITKTDYAFKQWKHLGGQKGFIIKSNAAYVIEWKPVCTITYTGGYDGVVYDDLTKVLDIGAVIRHPAAPERDGWKFVEWKYIGAGDEPATATVNTTFKFEAVWTKLHNVTFYNGETAIGDSLKVEHGNTIEYPAVPEAPEEGLVFGGWVVKQDGEENAAPIVAESDLDIYAKWLQRFTVTYTDGVEGVEIFPDFPREITEGQSVIRPAVPAQREGFIFTGWEWVGEGEEPAVITRNETYQACWKPEDQAKIITITFTDGVDDEVLFENETLQIAENAPFDYPEIEVTRAHYDFGGWQQVSVDADGNETYAVIWNKRPVLTYIVGEKGEEGYVEKSYEVDYNSNIRHPGIKEFLPDGRTGYVFDRWVREDGKTPVVAVADGVYKATWKVVVTFTDGVEGEKVFDDFTKNYEEGSTIAPSANDPKVPADRDGFLFKGWEQVGDTNTYQAIWKQAEITITYIHPTPQGEQTESVSLAAPEDGTGVSDEGYEKPEGMNKDKLYIGLYPVVMHNGNRCLKLVYKAAARSVDRIEYVPLGDTDGDGVPDIYTYAQKNEMPASVDPETEKFTESVELYHLELPDVGNNGVLDGKYELDPATGTVPKDEAGNEILEYADDAVYSIYKYYTRNGALIDTAKNDGESTYIEVIAMDSAPEYPDLSNDGIKFVKWVRDSARDEAGTYVSTYYIKGQVEPDVNNNDVYDANEDAAVLIVENDAVHAPKLYEDFINGEVSIKLSSPVVGKKAPVLSSSAFVLDSVNGTNIEISVDAEKGYTIRSVEVEPSDDSKAPELKDITSGDNASVKKFALKETKENTSELDSYDTTEYTVIIYLDKLETKESDLVFDAVSLPEFTVQKVYESVISYPKFDSAKNTAISYVAREADEDVPVSIEPLFQWIKDNYGSFGVTMVGYIDDYLDTILEKAGMSGLVTVENNVHYFHVNLGRVTKNLSETVSTPVKSAQDIANKHINAYVNELVHLMKTSSNDTTALEDHIAELPIMLADIQTEAATDALIRPFGYNAKGENVFYEYVTITVDGEPLHKNELAVAITDKRAVTNLNNGAALSVNYGTDANTALKNKAGVAGAHLHVSYNGQAATTYPAGVAFPGSLTNRPANATINLTIARQTANVQVPAKVVKEHNSSYEGQSPDPIVLVGGNVVTNVDVISVIAGVDLNKMDIDLQLSKDNTVTVKNVDPVAWIKLPGNLLTHVALVKKLDVDTSKFVNKMLEGKNLSAADIAKINDLLNQFLNENKVTCTLDEAIHLLEVFMPNAGAHQAKIEQALNAVKGTAEGNVKVTFSGGYPEDPGFFLNMGIVADSNYVHGVSADKNGKDFGVILNGPVLTMYNNGIQLVSDEVADAVHNVYTLENNGKTHALRVEGHADAEIFYYGLDSGLKVYYEGDGKTPPTKAGMYLVSAYVHDETSGKYMSDMAIMLIGVERTTTTVKGATVEYDGASHRLEVTTVTEKGEKVGRTIISGSIDKPANAGLKELRGLVNVDFPETIDNLWVHAVAHLESKFSVDLPDTIQAAELTPEQTVEFLNYCKTKVENKEFDNVLVNKVQEVVVQTLDSLISAMNEIIGRTNGKVVTIQFKNDIGYERHGVYLYHAIATDIERNQLYIPSADSGILIIHAPEEDFQMENQEVPYNGKEQLPEIHDETGREQFLVIYNQNTLSFILSQDGNAILNKLEALGVKDGITVEKLIEKGVDKISTEIVSGLITAGDALLEKIHKDDSELYQRAKDKLNAHVAARETQLVAKLESMLEDISEYVDPDTKLYFNKQPVDVGNYQVHAFSFGIAHEEATFKILPVITITAKDQKIYVGQDISREATDATYAVNPEDTQIVLPDDLGNITFNIYTAVEENGELVKGELVEAPLAAGTYFIEATAEEKEGYIIEAVTGTLTVEELTIVAYVNDKESETVAPGEKVENVTITVKALDKDGEEVTIPELTDAGYTIIDAEGKTVEADVDEEGKVTKSALAKALETAGTYTIKPAASNVPEENIKSATLTVKYDDTIGTMDPQKGSWRMSLDSVIYLDYYPAFVNFPENFDFANRGGVVVWTDFENAPTSRNDVVATNTAKTKVLHGMYQGHEGNWYVRTDEIYAKNLGDRQYIRPYVLDGEGNYVYMDGAPYYSPAEFCYDKLQAVGATGDREDERNICAGLLEYGAAAQTYFGYKTDKLVTTIPASYTNVKLSDYAEVLTFDKSWLSDEYVGGNVPTLAGTLTNSQDGKQVFRDTEMIPKADHEMNLHGAIRMTAGFTFNGVDWDQVKKAEVWYWTESQMSGLTELNRSNAIYIANLQKAPAGTTLGEYLSQSHHIIARKMGETVYFNCRIETNDGVVYCGGLNYYSPEAFIRDWLNDGADTAEDIVCRKLATYGEMVRVRFVDNADK